MTAIVLFRRRARSSTCSCISLRSYLKSSAPPTPIAIFRLDWQGMHLVQGFTADHEVLLDAVHSRRMDLPLVFQPDLYAHVPGSPTHTLARYLSGFSGRINVLWLSGGSSMPDMTREFPDVTSFAQDLGHTADVTRLSPVALYFADANGVGGGPTPQWASFDESIEEIASEWAMSLGLLTDPNPVSLSDSSSKPGLIARLNLDGGPHALRSARVLPAIVRWMHSSEHGRGDRRRRLLQRFGFKEVKSPKWCRRARTTTRSPTVQPTPTGTAPTERFVLRLRGWTRSCRRRSLREAWHGMNSPALAPSSSPNSNTATATTRGPPRPRGRPRLQAAALQEANASSASTAANTADGSRPAAPDVTGSTQRRLLTVSLKGDLGPHADDLERAMALGSPTPDAVSFTLVMNAPAAKEKIGRNDVLPADNFLTPPFRDKPFRNYTVHYWVDPANLRFTRIANGIYRDDLQFVTVIYRDDGMVANSLSTRSHIEIRAEDLESIQTSGVTLDQAVAVPVEGYFFVRAGVQERETGLTGALEVPAEIKLSSSLTATKLAQATK